MSNFDIGALTYMSLLLLFIGGGLFFGAREKLSTNLQYAAIWALIFLGVVVLYTLREPLSAGLYGASQTAQGDVVLTRARDGHFYTTLNVNGQDVEFVVDTGATDIVLSKEDAARVGLDPDQLVYFGTAQTANGVVRTARVTLDAVRLGQFVDYDMRAVVNDGDLFGSLLGMSYPNRFDEVLIRNGQMVLKR